MTEARSSSRQRRKTALFFITKLPVTVCDSKSWTIPDSLKIVPHLSQQAGLGPNPVLPVEINCALNQR